MDYKNFDRFGIYLKKVRKNNGFTQEGLAQEIGTNAGHISKWETGNNFPSEEYQIELSKVLNIPKEAYEYFDRTDTYTFTQSDRVSEPDGPLFRRSDVDNEEEPTLDDLPRLVRLRDMIQKKIDKLVN